MMNEYSLTMNVSHNTKPRMCTYLSVKYIASKFFTRSITSFMNSLANCKQSGAYSVSRSTQLLLQNYKNICENQIQILRLKVQNDALESRIEKCNQEGQATREDQGKSKAQS